VENRVLGIDPGLAHIGLAVIGEEKQLITATTLRNGKDGFGDLTSEAIACIEQGLTEAILRHESGPPPAWEVAIEDYSVFGFSGAIIRAAEMGEVIRLIIEYLVRELTMDRNQIFRYRSTDVRDYVCGNRRAKDAQVRECLGELGYTQRMNPHTRDALAVALFHTREGVD